MKLIYNDLSKIPDHNYEGYIWGSDQQYPQVLNGEKFVNPSDSLYIVEALLYCEKENISILIRHTGQTQICEYNLNKLEEGTELRDVSYLAHRLKKDIEKVNFKQVWIPEEDPNCNNWKVLKMKALVFTGFPKQKSSNIQN